MQFMFRFTFRFAGLLLALGLCPGAAKALSFADVATESEVGSGANEAMIVVDWKEGVSPSHAWLYRWDGSASYADAYAAIQAATLGAFDWSGGNFVEFMSYDDADGDQHDTQAAFFLSFWSSLDGVSWETIDVGVEEQLLVDGGWSGANPNLTDDIDLFPGDPPNVPLVPEPSTALLLGMGLALVGSRRRQTA